MIWCHIVFWYHAMLLLRMGVYLSTTSTTNAVKALLPHNWIAPSVLNDRGFSHPTSHKVVWLPLKNNCLVITMTQFISDDTYTLLVYRAVF